MIQLATDSTLRIAPPPWAASTGAKAFGLALFFASQGAGRMFWPLAGSVARLVIVALGGWACVHVLQVSASGFFFVVVAASLGLYGLIIAGAIKLGSWTR